MVEYSNLSLRSTKDINSLREDEDEVRKKKKKVWRNKSNGRGRFS